MKKIFLIATILLLLFFSVSIGQSSSCVENIEAKFTITSWSQEYLEYLEYWSYVEIWYDVTNTGNVDIDFYYVYFDVTCEDGSVFHDYTCDFGPKEGKTYSRYTIVDTAYKKATNVAIVDYELEVWDF